MRGLEPLYVERRAPALLSFKQVASPNSVGFNLAILAELATTVLTRKKLPRIQDDQTPENQPFKIRDR